MRVNRPDKRQGNATVVAKWFSLRSSILALFGITLLLVRLRIMHGTPTFTAENNPAAFVEEKVYRWLSYWHYYVVNVRLLLLPNLLCCDWSMGCIKTIRALWDFRNIPSFVLMIILVASLAFSAHSCMSFFTTAPQRIITSSIVLLIVPFLPASNLFFTVGFAVAERVLYLPSIGYCCFPALVLSSDLPASSRRQIGKFSLGLISSVFAYMARARNLDWRSSERIFGSGIRVCPDNAKLHYNLAHVSCKGVAESKTDQDVEYQRCKGLYEKAVSLAPNFGEALGALAAFYEETDVHKSAELLARAVKINPYSKRAHKNLGDLLARKDLSISRAIMHYDNAIRIDPEYADAYNNLGNTLLALGDMNKVEQYYRTALRLDPSHPNANKNMKTFFSQKKSPDRAQTEQRKEKKRHIDDLPTDSRDWNRRGWQLPSKPRKDGSCSDNDRSLKHKSKSKSKDRGKSKNKGRSKDKGKGEIERQGEHNSEIEGTSKRQNNDETEEKAGKGKTSLESGGKQGIKQKQQDRKLQQGSSSKSDQKVKGMKSWSEEDYRAAIQSEHVDLKLLKHYYNNLGVMVFQKATQQNSQQSFRRMRKEALALLQSAVKLSPGWAEARHNMKYVENNTQLPTTVPTVQDSTAKKQ